MHNQIIDQLLNLSQQNFQFLSGTKTSENIFYRILKRKKSCLSNIWRLLDQREVKSKVNDPWRLNCTVQTTDKLKVDGP